MGIKMYQILKQYQNVATKNPQIILNQVSLNIESGEMIAIKGKSGAGKSTLLHIIGLLDTMTDGTYILDDVDVKTLGNMQMADIRNKKIGFVLQDFGLIEDESVLYNVCLPLMFGRTRLKDIKEIALEKLKKVGIQKLAGKTVSLLSGGEKQRVAIARALVCNPDYILADEPTGALDSKNAENIMTILQHLNKEGKTVIIVTHDEMVAEMCDRTITIKDGRIQDTATHSAS